jgi:hypothetical protein
VLRRPGQPTRTVDPRTLPIGSYAGNPPLPMTPRTMLVDRTHDSLMGPPGIRLSMSTNRAARYWGTNAVPSVLYPDQQRPKANRPELLEVAPISAMRPKGLR